MKLKPSRLTIDSRYQRELDDTRASAMADAFDPDLLGMPVVSTRSDGTIVVLDGQHRVVALQRAGKGDVAIRCEEHSGLSLREEAALFLKLNSGRKAVRVFDKFQARLVAKEPDALEIKRIVEAAGLRIAKAQGTNCVCAVAALEQVHRRQCNLGRVLSVLVNWADGDPGVFEGQIIKDVAVFLAAYPQADLLLLARKLAPKDPERVLSMIKRLQGVSDDVPRALAANKVLRDIYNTGTPRNRKLPPASDDNKPTKAAARG